MVLTPPDCRPGLQSPGAASFRETEETMAYLYLCKMDPNVTGEARFIGIIGAIVETRNWLTGNVGYQFVPHVSAHKRSRKIWDSAIDSIPSWTDRHGYLQLLDANELKTAQERARKYSLTIFD